MSMYIRFKRKNQTLFLHAEPSNNFSQLKARIGEILSVDPSRIMIIGSDKVKILIVVFAVSYPFLEKGNGGHGDTVRSRNPE